MNQASSLFDRSFDVLGREQEAKFTEDDLSAAREAGFVEGRAAAAEEACRSNEGQLIEVATKLVDRVAALVAQDDERRSEIAQDCAWVLRCICERAIPSLAANETVNSIVEVVRECLKAQTDEPRIVIRVANEVSHAIEPLLADLSKQAGFSGKLILIPDEALNRLDCAVLWADGGAERDYQHIWSQIEQLLQLDLTPSGAAEPIPTHQPVSS